MRFDVAGRTALVTGGTSGIGLAFVRALLERGAACVLVVGRDAGRLAAVEAEGAGRVMPLAMDLGDNAAVDALLRSIPDRAPDLSLLVNNAAVQTLAPGLVAGGPPDALPALRHEMAVNLGAAVALSVGLLPHLARLPSAAILNVTTGLVLAPKRSAPVYCATKAGLRAFTQALRYQCEDHAPHVRVVEALPPMVDTAMTTGRGRGKITSEACAAEIVAGLEAGRAEVWVGRSKLLRAIHRASPALARRIMRDG